MHFDTHIDDSASMPAKLFKTVTKQFHDGYKAARDRLLLVSVRSLSTVSYNKWNFEKTTSGTLKFDFKKQASYFKSILQFSLLHSRYYNKEYYN
jgi:hypothetical protein